MNDTAWPDYEKNPNAEEFRKLFVGGLDSKTTEETLKDYFSSYGPIQECEIMKDRSTPAKSKGFGFVTFTGTSSIDEIQKNRPHEIDGKKIETKRATPKQQQYWPTKKLYIKNFPKDQTEDELINEMKDVFSKYGTIVSVKLIKENQGKDSTNNASLKGFGFIEFDDEDPVDKCNLVRKFMIKGSEAQVSKAYPQDKGPGGRGRGGNYYYEEYMYPPYDFYHPQNYGGGRPYGGGRYGGGGGGGRGDYYHGYDYYQGGGRNYSRGGGGGGGRSYRGNRY